MHFVKVSQVSPRLIGRYISLIEQDVHKVNDTGLSYREAGFASAPIHRLPEQKLAPRKHSHLKENKESGISISHDYLLEVSVTIKDPFPKSPAKEVKCVFHGIFLRVCSCKLAEERSTSLVQT